MNITLPTLLPPRLIMIISHLSYSYPLGFPAIVDVGSLSAPLTLEDEIADDSRIDF